MKKLLQKMLEAKIKDSLDSHKKMTGYQENIFKVIDLLTKSILKGGKLLLCGNGGSAADAQHLAAEFLVRLRPKINRAPLPAITLAQDTSTITALANDYDFKYLFSRNFKALVKKNDVLIAISTSGKSENILEVLKEAKKLKIKSVGFLGYDGGKAKKLVDYPLIVPSKVTSTIQENHIFLGHFIFECVEDNLI
jgi:D-sedoheptulose 7-phosphate isomerase